MTAAGPARAAAPAPDPALADALASIRDAATVKCPPWMAVVAALGSARPASVGASIDWLVAHRARLEAAHAEASAGPLALPDLPADLAYEPELGYLDRPRDDHRLRDRYLFADLVGQRTWFQTAIYALTGLELSPSDALLVEEIAVANVVVDRRAWPMAVTRRVAGHGGGVSAAIVAGMATMTSPFMAGLAGELCCEFLIHAADARDRGQPVAVTVAELLARGERIVGYGRPMVGPDERTPVMAAIIARHGRSDGRFLTTMREAEVALAEAKGLRGTAASWSAAVFLDLGFTPAVVNAFTHYLLGLCVVAQAVYADERARSTGLTPAR